MCNLFIFFFFSSRRRHTRSKRDWSSDVCSSDLSKSITVRRLGKQTVIDLLRILPMSIAELLGDWFENDTLKGVLGAAGVWHLRQGPRAGGTAFNFLHHHVGSPAGVFRPSRSNVTQILTAMPGVEVRRGATATVAATGGRVTGVRRGSEELSAPVVVSSADPRTTFEPLKPQLD